MSLRRRRSVRQLNWLLTSCLATVLALVVFTIWSIAPSEADKPFVTVYASSDCRCCQRWIEHMRDRGFRVQMAPAAQRTSIREHFGVPANMQACHTAVVDGVLLEGHVPAHDVHQLLQWKDRATTVALMVPGMPRGSPGMESLVHDPYTVYALRTSGNVRAFFDHDPHELQ